MEIEPSKTELRIAGNVQVLAEVESEVVSLEEAFTAIEQLRTERDRLATAVQGLHTEEAQILSDGASSESVIVRKLIEIRARRDVQAARLTSIEDKLKQQATALDGGGASVRRAFQAVIGRLYVSRQERMVGTLLELFGSDWIILRDGKRAEMKYLAKHTKLMKQVRDLDNKVSHPIADQEQETAALQRSRGWLDELRILIEGEPGLVLRVPAKPQPIEQPRELVAV